MVGAGMRRVIIGVVVLCALTAALVGCATDTKGTNATGHLTVPQTVAPPDQVPPELAPYLPRYGGVLDFWGFKPGPTTDPQALKLELRYSGKGKETKLIASLLQQGKPVLTATAVPNTSVPWHWFGTSQQADLLQDLANNDIEQFDEQLKIFTKQLEIIKAPGAATAEALSEASFTEFGTAFAVGSPNTFLTANHVVSRAGEIRLYCGRDESGVAILEADDTGNDLALLHATVSAKAFLQLAPDGSL